MPEKAAMPVSTDPHGRKVAVKLDQAMTAA
jgi:hypothetical protein